MTRSTSRPTPHPSNRVMTWARAALAAALVPLLPAALAAQKGTVDPGMTRAQVVERLGKPKALSTSGEHSYLFYSNGCARTCGMDDVVVLERDSVVDAIFRSPAHRYTGVSSSPAALAAGAARGAGIVRTAADSGTTPAGAAARGGIVIGGAATDSAQSTAARRRSRSPGRARRRAPARASRAAAAAGLVASPATPAHAPAPPDTGDAASRRPVAIPGQAGAPPAPSPRQ
ncbi:MAG: hypothetical protein ACJ79S_05195 [Gemmatimonadaceae bacterium]